jgi:PAS domain S-box-containing protein
VTDPVLYRKALDALPHLVWVAGPDGALEYLNRRCAEYCGVPIDDLLGWDWSWVMHPADLPNTLAVWNASVRAGTSHEVEFRLRRCDGDYRWFLARAEPVRDPQGRIERWFGTCTDINESKRLADELLTTRTLFRALVERSADGLVLVGANGTVRYINPLGARLLGAPVDNITGTDLWGSVCSDDRREVCTWWERVLANPGESLATITRFLVPGGALRPLQVLGTNLVPDPEIRAVAVQLRPVEGDASAHGGALTEQ